MSYSSATRGQLDRTADASRARVTGAVLAVVAFAALLRLWAAASLPLIITNDGTEYLSTGMRLAEGAGLSIVRPIRTPGYPLFLAGVFKVFGTGPVAILIWQHILGVAACGLVAYAAGRLTRPVLGLLAGLVLALDPWLFALESYALSEALTVFLVAVAVALTLGPVRPRSYQALLIGIALGVACLTRPACQVLVPFVGVAWLLRARANRGWRRLLLGGAAGIIGLAGVLGPWVLFNRSRDVEGVASGYSEMQFKGLLRFGLVDRDFPGDPELAAAFGDLDPANPTWAQMRTFVAQHIRPWIARGGRMSAWNRASIADHLGEYVRHCGYALAWQLNWFPDYGPKPGYSSWPDWSLERLSRDGSNKQYEGDSTRLGLDVFAMDSRGGSLRALFGWLSVHAAGGLPQLLLFGFALTATIVALVGRRSGLALVVIGSLAFTLAHVMLLFPVGRYLAPMTPVWCICVVFVVGAVGGRILPRRASGSPELGSTELERPAAELPAVESATRVETPVASESQLD
jgi:4-amino-4-deoxy-L-arabinose transferase-like glycosyltransferase